MNNCLSLITPTASRIAHNGCDAMLAEYDLLLPQLLPSMSTNEQAALVLGCTFTTQKENETLSIARRMLDEGATQVILTGCASRLNSLPSTEMRAMSIADVFRQYNISDHDQQRRLQGPLITVSTGCRSKCTFCSIRNARGWQRSRAPDDIIKDARDALSNYDRIRLVGQDVAAYGRDFGSTLWDLLRTLIDQLPAIQIELGSLNPRWLKLASSRDFETLCHPSIVGNTHIAIQSGSDRVLQRMNRGYCSADVREILWRLRHRAPTRGFSADFLFGYPEESEDDHSASLQLIREEALVFGQFFMFEPRPNTPAAAIRDLSTRIKQKRTFEGIATFLKFNGRLDSLTREPMISNDLPFNTNISISAVAGGSSDSADFADALVEIGAMDSLAARTATLRLGMTQQIRAITESADPSEIFRY